MLRLGAALENSHWNDAIECGLIFVQLGSWLIGDVTISAEVFAVSVAQSKSVNRSSFPCVALNLLDFGLRRVRTVVIWALSGFYHVVFFILYYYVYCKLTTPPSPS